MIGALARVAPHVDARHAKAARAFLRQALGELPPAELEQRVVQAYRHFLRVLVEPMRFLRRVPAERIREHYDIRWTDAARAAAEGSDGCILVTGHVGNWEAAIAIAPWIGFDPVYAVARPPKNRLLSIAAQEDRERRGIRVLPRRGGMKDAAKVLEAGGSIGMVLDQRARRRPVLAPFFGRPARCDRSAGVLIKRLGAPAVVSACYLTEEPLHYRVEFLDCLSPEELATSDPVEIATRINQAFERMYLAHPEQVFWLHDRFKDTPEAFPADEGPESRGKGAGEGPVPRERAKETSPR